MLNSEENIVISTKTTLTTTPATLKPIIINTNDLNIMNEGGEYLTKNNSPSSFLKTNFITSSSDVNPNNATNSLDPSAGGYRRSPVSCQSVEEESVRSSSSRVCLIIHLFYLATNSVTKLYVLSSM